MENLIICMAVVAVVCLVLSIGGWLVERAEKRNERIKLVHYTWRTK